MVALYTTTTRSRRFLAMPGPIPKAPKVNFPILPFQAKFQLTLLEYPVLMVEERLS